VRADKLDEMKYVVTAGAWPDARTWTVRAQNHRVPFESQSAAVGAVVVCVKGK